MTAQFPNIRRQQNCLSGRSQHLRANPFEGPARPRSNAARSYFRRLHAAEMAAWQITGGDYVLAGFVPRHS